MVILANAKERHPEACKVIESTSSGILEKSVSTSRVIRHVIAHPSYASSVILLDVRISIQSLVEDWRVGDQTKQVKISLERITQT